MMAAIQLEGITKTYQQGGKKLAALQSVSFTIDQGEAFGFVGPNGAGKSTAIKILTGAVRADSGQARLFDIDVNDHHSRTGMGYVPENPSLYDYLTPLEILRMGVQAHRLVITDVNVHCQRWLERFDIAHVANKRLRGFSKGMLQRTALAHAMACQPKLLILDEPLSGLDPIGRRDVVDILIEYRKQGGTIFFSSHVLHDVERLADRFGLIHRGTLRTISQPADLVSSEQDMMMVRSSGTVAVEGMSQDFGNRWHAQVPRRSLWTLLNQLHTAGHEIIELRPALSLEQVFLQYVGKDQPQTPPKQS